MLLAASFCRADPSSDGAVDSVPALLAVLPTAPAAAATIVNLKPSARLVFAAGGPVLTIRVNTSVVLNCNGARLVDDTGGPVPPAPNFLVVQAGADLTLNDCHLELGNLILYPEASGALTTTSRVAPSASCQLNRGSVAESNCAFLDWAAPQAWLYSSQPSNATYLWVTYTDSRDFMASGPVLLDVLMTCVAVNIPLMGRGFGVGPGGGVPPAPSLGPPPAVSVVQAATAEDIMTALSYARTGHLQIDLMPTKWYNFTAPESIMAVASGVSVTINCNGATLLDCYSCRPSQVAMEPNYMDLADKATLSLNDCELRSLEPVSPPDVSTTMEMLRIEKSAKLILRGGVGHNTNCQAVNWLPMSGMAKTTRPYNASSYFVTFFDFAWPPILMLDMQVTCPLAPSGQDQSPTPAPVNVASYMAASVEDLVGRLQVGGVGESLAITLVPGAWYNFTQQAQSLYVPEHVSVTVDCGGAVLKDCSACDPQRPFIELNDGAQLTLINCTLITSNLVLDTVDATSITWAPSMDINSSLTVIGGVAEEEDCQVVAWMSHHLGTSNGLTINTTQPLNASYIYVSDLRTDPLSPAGWPNVTVHDVAFLCCPPELAPISPLEGWRLAALVLGVVVVALTVAVLVAYRHRRVIQTSWRKASGSEGSGADVVVSVGRAAGGGAGDVNADAIITTAVAEMRENLKAEHLQVHDVIGRGGHGTVYRGTWRGLAVAVKIVVFQGIHPSDAVMQLAAAEASIAYNLSHPNIVATYSHELKPIYGEEVGTLLCWRLSLVQELCNGGTLTELLERGVLRGAGGMVLSRALTVLLDVAAALAHLHSRRIAHGDLTPNNVLLRVADAALVAPEDCDPAERIALALDAGNCVAKVTDFGMSMRIDPGVSHASGIFHGTPFYCAPELLQEHRLQEASDVFSYGVIMWQCATSCTPYISVSGILRRHPRFPYFPPGVPDAYALLALACMAVNPRERPSFAAVADVLHALRRGLLTECSSVALQPSVLPPHVPLAPGPPLHGPGDVSSRTDLIRSSRHVSFTDGVDAADALEDPPSISDVWADGATLDSCFLASWRPQTEWVPPPPGPAGGSPLIAAAAATAPRDDWIRGGKGAELSLQCRDLRAALEDVLSSMLDTVSEDQG